MRNPDHLFKSGGKCVFCGATPEAVADRKAPRFCEERPIEQDDRADVDPVSGY